MATVSKHIADKVVAGNGYYPGDEVRVVRIVEYKTVEGDTAYGIEYEDELGRYRESAYVRQPRVYWKWR